MCINLNVYLPYQSSQIISHPLTNEAISFRCENTFFRSLANNVIYSVINLHKMARSN